MFQDIWDIMQNSTHEVYTVSFKVLELEIPWGGGGTRLAVKALARISELGVQKYTFGGEFGPIPFHPIALYTKDMDIRVSKISNRVSKRHPDTLLPSG